MKRKIIGWTLLGTPFLVTFAVLWAGAGLQAALIFVAGLVVVAAIAGSILTGLALLEP